MGLAFSFAPVQDWSQMDKYKFFKSFKERGEPPHAPSHRIYLPPEFPGHDFHCLGRVLAAGFLPPGEVGYRAHALTGRANATIAHLMHGDEVLGLAFGRLREELEQA